MLRRLESRINPTALPPEADPPPGLAAFYWHYVGQAKGLFVLLFIGGFIVALLDTTIPIFIGRLVTLLTTTPREAFFAATWPTLALMAFVILVARPLMMLVQNTIAWVIIIPRFTNAIRWQSHWHVVRQSLPFFQNDFAGRIASRVMQTGPSLRESIVASVRAVWHVTVYGTGAAILMAAQDWRLLLPVFFWFIGYLTLLRLLVPRMRERSKDTSEARSALTGRIVDSYTNILTVKLFARSEEEDQYVRESMDEHTGLFLKLQWLVTTLFGLLSMLNACLIVSTAGLALWLWSQGTIEVGAVAMILPLTWNIVAMAGWVAFEVSGIFENVGMVQEGMETIARPLGMRDATDAKPLKIDRGLIRFQGVRFHYGKASGVIDEFSASILPGEKVGLVGRSGAGKTTLMNLLLRFHDRESGRITIDGQDIARVTQESLRAQISVVTQDTSLLHRSIRDNIRYGRRGADEGAVRMAAERAEAAEFIARLEDWKGRTGFDAHVGERGVKLSGGQRQRIAIARVILKDAPILVLDEATSALDSEVEAAIQSSLTALMRGKTVIAIAHRLSTLQIMDRLIVIDHGRIVEEGTHATLIAKGGLYADLWNRQSGGFLADQRERSPFAAE